MYFRASQHQLFKLSPFLSFFYRFCKWTIHHPSTMDIPLTNPGLHALQLSLDELTSRDSIIPWRAALPFECRKIEKCAFSSSGPVLPVIHPTHNFVCQNILSPPELSGFSWKYAKVHFDPDKYPVLDGFRGTGWNDLRRDIGLASRKAGFELFCNGSQYGGALKDASRTLVCSHYSAYRGKKRDEVVGVSYRNSSINNDRRLNTRGSAGRSMPRRTATRKPTKQCQTCKLKLLFKVDPTMSSFFLELQFSNHD